MKTIVTFLLLIAFSVLAQTAYNYTDPTLTPAQGIALAMVALQSGTLSDTDASNAVVWILIQRPTSLLLLSGSGFADGILKDPSLHGLVSGTDQIIAECAAASHWKSDAITGQ